MPSRILQIIAERVKLLHEPPPKPQQQETKSKNKKIPLENKQSYLNPSGENPKPIKNENK